MVVNSGIQNKILFKERGEVEKKERGMRRGRERKGRKRDVFSCR